MNIPTLSSPANASIGSKAEVFGKILQPEINIVVQQRSVDHFSDTLKALLDVEISLKASGTPGEVLQVLQAHLDGHGLFESPLVNDIGDLLCSFQAVTTAQTFRVSLAVIDSDMCRRFHSDINDLRMLCTYWGAGTLWVAESSSPGETFLSRDEDGALNPHPNCIRQATAGDVLILKGALYPNGQPVIHKSPSIEAEGSARLMLRIDTNEKPIV